MFKNYPDWTKAIHKEGHVFLIIFSAVTFLMSSANGSIGWVCFIATLWCAFFFRNPERVTPVKGGLVVSAADGIVQSITTTKPPSELGLGDVEMTRISVFLNLFNVHVNRVPIDGKILKLHYHPGRFFNASLDKASVHNERQSILLETNKGVKIAFVQIAGLIARRIVCDLEEGAEVTTGSRFGIIRFGSRVDVYIPTDAKLHVTEGQTTIGGETILADLSQKAKDSLEFETR